MKEEDILLKKFGRKNDFSVPDGYFESFADQLMAQLPESQDDARVIDMRPESWWHRIPLGKIAAGLSAAVVIGAGALWMSMQKPHVASTEMMSAAQTSTHSASAEYSTFDEMADYVMIDNQDCYASLVAEN